MIQAAHLGQASYPYYPVLLCYSKLPVAIFSHIDPGSPSSPSIFLLFSPLFLLLQTFQLHLPFHCPGTGSRLDFTSSGGEKVHKKSPVLVIHSLSAALPGKGGLASKYKQHQALGVWRCAVYSPSGKEVNAQAKKPSAGEMCDHVCVAVLLWAHAVILTNGRKFACFLFLALTVTKIFQRQQDGSVAESACHVRQSTWVWALEPYKRGRKEPPPQGCSVQERNKQTKKKETEAHGDSS